MVFALNSVGLKVSAEFIENAFLILPTQGSMVLESEQMFKKMYYPQRKTRFQAKKVQKVVGNIQGSVHSRGQIPGDTVKRPHCALSSADDFSFSLSSELPLPTYKRVILSPT